MERDRAWYDARQKVVGEASQKAVTSVLEASAGYADPVERTYFSRAPGVSVLVARYLQVLNDTSGTGADEWLHDQIRGLALVLNDVSPRKIRIMFGVEPVDGTENGAAESGS